MAREGLKKNIYTNMCIDFFYDSGHLDQFNRSLCFGTSLDIFCFTLPEEDTKIKMPSTIMQNQETDRS
jgi:hypothetical protein